METKQCIYWQFECEISYLFVCLLRRPPIQKCCSIANCILLAYQLFQVVLVVYFDPNEFCGFDRRRQQETVAMHVHTNFIFYYNMENTTNSMEYVCVCARACHS